MVANGPAPKTPFGGTSETLRFLDVELDVGAYELRRRGRRVRLERQPMDLLILLVQRRGQLVARTDIVERLWGPDVFIDVDTGIHRAILKIRQALHDSADSPAFIETVSGKGYRFIAPTEVVSPSLVEHPAAGVMPERERSEPATQTPPGSAPQPGRPSRRPAILLGTAVVGVIGLIAALLWVASGGLSRTPDVTLAVLPFENLSGDPAREYLTDGLTEETIASLGQVDPQHVSVIGRTSMMAYKGTTESLADIGRALGVDYLVEGSMRAEGERVRVTSTLIRVQDQTQVWSASYDSEPTSTLAVQQELSAAIAQQIRLRLSRHHLTAIERRQTHDPDAYDLYLRGVSMSGRRTPEANRAAIEYYQRAIALDPDYALAWSGIALTYSASTINSGAAPLDVAPHAKAAARRAVRLAPGLAEAQLALGHVSWFGWDWETAEDAFRKAVALDPSSAQGHYLLGHALSQRGRHNEARPLLARARALDFLDPMMHAMSAQVAFQARDYTAALEHGRQATVIDGEFWIGHMQVANAHQQSGRGDLALEVLTRGRLRDTAALALRGYILAKQGHESEAREVLNALAAKARDSYVSPSHVALVHAGLGDRQAVFDWLDRAHAARDVHLIFLTVDPKWDPYRADPRFDALLDRCGFSHG